MGLNVRPDLHVGTDSLMTEEWLVIEWLAPRCSKVYACFHGARYENVLAEASC